MKNYIKCVDVAYESSMMEDFYDIQLSVKGMRTLHDSFKDYVQVETLEGENKYMAEGYGLQDAKKGVIFERFPPVLHLQLRRFEYDMEKDAMCKVRNRTSAACPDKLQPDFTDMTTHHDIDQRSSRVPLRDRSCRIPRSRIG